MSKNFSLEISSKFVGHSTAGFLEKNEVENKYGTWVFSGINCINFVIIKLTVVTHHVQDKNAFKSVDIQCNLIYTGSDAHVKNPSPVKLLMVFDITRDTNLCHFKNELHLKEDLKGPFVIRAEINPFGLDFGGSPASLSLSAFIRWMYYWNPSPDLDIFTKDQKILKFSRFMACKSPKLTEQISEFITNHPDPHRHCQIEVPFNHDVMEKILKMIHGIEISPIDSELIKLIEAATHFQLSESVEYEYLSRVLENSKVFIDDIVEEINLENCLTLTKAAKSIGDGKLMSAIAKFHLEHDFKSDPWLEFEADPSNLKFSCAIFKLARKL